jgi:hypothetical protein
MLLHAERVYGYFRFTEPPLAHIGVQWMNYNREKNKVKDGRFVTSCLCYDSSKVFE